MGQYWKAVNLDKREYVHPHELGSGLKLWEQLANSPGVGEALVVLCAAMPEARGGGDLDLDANWHGKERVFPTHNSEPGPMPTAYPEIAAQTIGRWAGDRIALLGDYAEDSDLVPGRKGDSPASMIYALCRDEAPPEAAFTNITPLVAAVIEHELQGRYVGGGWKTWKTEGQIAADAKAATKA